MNRSRTLQILAGASVACATGALFAKAIASFSLWWTIAIGVLVVGIFCVAAYRVEREQLRQRVTSPQGTVDETDSCEAPDESDEVTPRKLLLGKVYLMLIVTLALSLYAGMAKHVEPWICGLLCAMVCIGYQAYGYVKRRKHKA